MNNINKVTVYLGSSGRCRSVFKDTAKELGSLIGASGKSLIYGGMDAGLMGLLADASLKTGAHVTGIIPRKLKDSERILKNLSETIMVEDLCDRKKLMFKMADAVISLPGGFGTVDESLEMLYWGNLGLHNKPLVLVNIDGYWDDFITYLQGLPDFKKGLLIIVNEVSEIIPALEEYTPPIPTPEEPNHYPHFEDEISRKTAEPILIDIPTVENSYYAICALGLKQLHKHQRAIGFLNNNGGFDKFVKWMETAQKENFITDKCLNLFTVGTKEDELRASLKKQEFVEINLHNDKWGNSEV